MNRAAVVAVAILLILFIAWSSGRAFPEATGGEVSGFLGTFDYAPACGAIWPGRRRADCRGITTGVMPSIETAGIDNCGLGCGRLGGIPP